MVDALERITNLVALLLETRSPVTLEQIVNELQGQYPAGESAARGAFERDKAMLREIGVPIESQVLAGSDAGKTAYWIDRRRYELADLDLTADERQALQMAVAAARLSEGEFGLLKLGADGGAAATVVTNIPDAPALPALREASAHHASASFRYHGTQRELHPYALLLREGFWYVIGLDLAHDAQRTYRVDRIEGDVEVGAANAFTRPIDFDPRQAFPSDPKLIGDEPALRAVVHVDAPRAAAAVADLGDEAVIERLDGGAVRVSVPCTNLDAFRSWLFGLGRHAEVIAPPEVRSSVAEWLRSMVVAG
ncbi:MAG: WYL domain-containing protein [Actinobacteria bacterium]|nr:WYL domain-containing protein [Actinomycetota bacterium]